MAGLLLLALLACGPKAPDQVGVASWYGKELAGRPTASGQRFRPWRRTAAHRSLPFGTVLKVTRPENGKTVRVVVNDRGPFVAGRVVDLSRKAARRLDMLDDGLATVELRVVGCRERYGRCP